MVEVSVALAEALILDREGAALLKWDRRRQQLKRKGGGRDAPSGEASSAKPTATAAGATLAEEEGQDRLLLREDAKPNGTTLCIFGRVFAFLLSVVVPATVAAVLECGRSKAKNVLRPCSVHQVLDQHAFIGYPRLNFSPSRRPSPPE